MTSYNVTATTPFGDMTPDHVADIVTELQPYGAVVAPSATGAAEVVLTVHAPNLEAATGIALTLLASSPVPYLDSLVVETSAAFDRRHGLEDDEPRQVLEAAERQASDEFAGRRHGMTREQAQAAHPAFRH